MFHSRFTLPILCLAIASGEVPAQADIYTSRYPVSQETSVPAIVSAHVMGARGFANYRPPSAVDWRSALRDSCASWTMARLGHASLWAEGCDPHGMARAMSEVAAQHWVTLTYASTDQQAALDQSISALASPGLRSPAVVPIFGQADHWVASDQIDAVPIGVGRYSLRSVSFFDALGVPLDSGMNMFYSGRMTMSGLMWTRLYFLVTNAINVTCDPNCTSDPYFNKFVVTYDPPPDASHLQASTEPSPNHFIPVAAPGINTVEKGMSERAAQMGVMRALRLAGLDRNAEVFPTMASSRTGSARLVHGTDPAGRRWDYYLVPMHDDTGAVSAFVQLSAQDGAFESSMVFEKPVEWQPVDENVALQLANNALRSGERLSGDGLAWSAAVNDIHVKSPHLPYYQFSVRDKAGTLTNTLLVTLHGGHVIRLPVQRTRQSQ